MLRNRTLKYVHYVGQRPQLFNLLDDPQECHDLADDPSQQSVLQEFQSTLGALLDPQQTDAKARADQQALIETFGGEAAVRKRGAFDNSPVPGEPPAFRSHG
jgi:choline-sulfatase